MVGKVFFDLLSVLFLGGEIAANLRGGEGVNLKRVLLPLLGLLNLRENAARFD